MASRLSTVSCLGFLALIVGVKAQSTYDFGCYLPDGSVAQNYTSCNSQAEQSSCCYFNDVCLDNGYCLQEGSLWTNRIARGACTDESWDSNKCPYYCTDVTPKQSTTIYLAYDTEFGAFCCGAYDNSTESCLNPTHNSTAPFSLQPAGVIYNRTDGATIKNGSLTTLGESSASTATVTATATGHASNTHITSIAAGIAVPLGILLLASLAAIAILLLQLRKLRQNVRSQSIAIPQTDMQQQQQQQQWSPYSPTNASTQDPFSPQQQQPSYAAHGGDPYMAKTFSTPFVQADSRPYHEAPTGRELSESDSKPVYP